MPGAMTEPQLALKIVLSVCQTWRITGTLLRDRAVSSLLATRTFGAAHILAAMRRPVAMPLALSCTPRAERRELDTSCSGPASAA